MKPKARNSGDSRPTLASCFQPVMSNFGEPSLTETDLAGRDPHRWLICGGIELLERSLRSFVETAGAHPRSPMLHASSSSWAARKAHKFAACSTGCQTWPPITVPESTAARQRKSSPPASLPGSTISINRASQWQRSLSRPSSPHSARTESFRSFHAAARPFLWKRTRYPVRFLSLNPNKTCPQRRTASASPIHFTNGIAGMLRLNTLLQTVVTALGLAA